ncbi:MAG: MFS transporter [Gemmataceae bacterium]
MSTAIQTSPVWKASNAPALPAVFRWLNVVIAATAMTATLPGRTHGLGMITKPVIDDAGLGISESDFAVYNLLAILIGSTMVVPVGWLLDRIGPRFVTGAISLGLGLAVLAMGFAPSAVVFLAALILVRGLGQGSLSVASIALVGKSFSRRVGIAMGVFTILLSIGFMASTLGLGYAVGEMGWRHAWSGLGWLLIAGMAPLAWLLSRNDAKESADIADERDPDRLVADATLGQALATPAFWVWAFGVGLFNLVWSAVTLFNETLLLDHGLSRSVFILVMGVLVFTGLPANIFAGWLSQRWSMSKLLGIGMAVLATSLAGFP